MSLLPVGHQLLVPVVAASVKARGNPRPDGKRQGDAPPPARLREMDQSDFQTHFLGTAKPVLVVFGAPWCEPCQELAPKLPALARHWRGKLEVFEVTLPPLKALGQGGQTSSLARYFVEIYRVDSLPSAILFHGGAVMARYDLEIESTPEATVARLRRLVDRQLGKR